MKRELRLFVEDILENIEYAESFSKGLSKQDLEKSRLKQNAIFCCLEIIGEASKNIPDFFRIKYPEIPWKEISGFRDVLIHAYFGVDVNRVWKVVREDFPILKKQILKIKKQENWEK